jgi:hypothetical protein
LYYNFYKYVCSNSFNWYKIVNLPRKLILPFKNK